MKKKLIDTLCELEPPPNLLKANDKFDVFYSNIKPSIDSNLYYNLINNNSNVKKLLIHIFGISDFLSLCLSKNLDYFFKILDNNPNDSLEFLIKDTNSIYLNYLEDSEKNISLEKRKKNLSKNVRLIKQKISLLVALNDITKTWSLTQVIENLSYLADQLIKTSVDCLLLESSIKGEFKLNSTSNPGFKSSYVILAVGKLGGKELNYSSDVDLIALYDNNVNKYLGSKSPHDYFVKITSSLVKLLSERTEDGYVFRTDFRLRPDAGATPLALSITAAETYYESVGQNWERAAMIKARPIAGDIDLGKMFIENLKPFIWRKNLDYAAISDIKSIKRQIDSKENNSNLILKGYNVKLGMGGIREIEFFAQTQQLIYGGRNHFIRTSSTIKTLIELEKNNYITKNAKEDLINSYIFLRTLEHRIQMISDEQTHSIPKNSKNLLSLITFFGLKDEKYLKEKLLFHTNNVQKHYKKLFKDSSPLVSNYGNLVFTGSEDDPRTLITLKKLGFENSESISKIIREWHHSRYRATRSIRAREILTDMIPKILHEFSKTSKPDYSFKKFDQFLSKLPEGVQLFSLFESNPNLLDLLAEILATSPYLSEFLENSPNVLDIVISDDFKKLNEENFYLNDLSNHLNFYDNFQDILDQTRRWARERRFQIGIHLLRGKISGVESSQLFTNLAIAIIKNILNYTLIEFKSKYGEVENSEYAIIGLGTLGSEEMQFNSDLDLIFVYENKNNIKESNGKNKLETSRYFARLSQLFINAITSLTNEGKIYEIDMRLRPSGNSGPIATSIDSFEEYHNQSSWVWEKMALTRAKPIAGDKRIISNLNTLIKKILSKKIPPKILIKDILSMREKIKKEQIINKWKVKNSNGGLMDIQFISQYLQLLNSTNNMEIFNQKTDTSLINLKENKLLKPEIADKIIEISDFQFNIHALVSLCYKDQVNQEQFSEEIYFKLYKILKVNDKFELNNKLSSIQEKIINYFNTIIHL